MLKGGLRLIKETISSINPSERFAAQYILDNPEKMVRMTVSELAEASGSSQSAIIRLCKSLGLKGYQDLKLRVAGDLQNSSTGEEYQEISPKSDIRTIISSVSNNNIYSINETLNILDPVKIEEAVYLIENAKRIDFYGTGASQLVAQDAQHKFMRINKACTAYSDTHLQLTSAVTLTENDVAVAFSHSGETIQVIECIKAAKENGAKTIGITRYGANTIGHLVDVHIETLSTESDIRSAATSSRIVQLNIVDILYIAVVGHNYHQSLTQLNKSRLAIDNCYRLKRKKHIYNSYGGNDDKSI
ncbi:MurR/RpiR family transcriptional regulator [Tuberibacillus calidus]|uniref:MurR/RpiR family transcriptional regulator n=1 Tax=Tuberibacillus calidus TaxID=340097 RepID=UPI0003FF35F1|nr:MurR/RpiR family transcriptional regulator [Tuberibacillus calidus]